MRYRVKKFTKTASGTQETDYGIVGRNDLDQMLAGIHYDDEIRVWEVASN